MLYHTALKQPSPPPSPHLVGEGRSWPSMSLPPNGDVWITLMHELQSFIRCNLDKPETMAEVRNLMAPPIAGRFAPSPRIAAAQFVRAFELLAPALMVDFLEENKQFLNQRALANWAAEREELFDIVTDMSA